jgi:hypothetical protein
VCFCTEEKCFAFKATLNEKKSSNFAFNTTKRREKKFFLEHHKNLNIFFCQVHKSSLKNYEKSIKHVQQTKTQKEEICEN